MLEVYKVAASNFATQLLELSGNAIAVAKNSQYGFIRTVASNLTPKMLVVVALATTAFACFNAAYLAKGNRCFRPMAPIYAATGLMLAIAAVAAFVLLPSP